MASKHQSANMGRVGPRRPRGSAAPGRIRAQAPLAVAGAGAESFSIGAGVDGVVDGGGDSAQGRGCYCVMIAGRWHRRGWEVVGGIGWFGRLLPESRLQMRLLSRSCPPW